MRGPQGDAQTVQELLGHRSVRTTMIYTHVLNRGGRGVRSPLDALGRDPARGMVREGERPDGRHPNGTHSSTA